MKKIVVLLLFLCLSVELAAQNQGPWNNPLMIAYSQDGTTFQNAKVFQDSSGVPSMARNNAGDLIAAFQWFPAPFRGKHWDSVAVKFSSDQGNTWTMPKAIKVNGLPSNFQRPFDPAITVTDNGQYRLYFSSGVVGGIGLNNAVDTYSALSNDGINYTFDANARFDQSAGPVIDPTLLKFNGVWHYFAPKGAPADGAYHATSADGLLFTAATDIPSDNNHNWTGNLMLESASQLRFYGSGPKIWWSSSSDGSGWSTYTATNIQGGDPAVIKIAANQYIMVYVGKSQLITSVESTCTSCFVVYPNPAHDEFFISRLKESEPAELIIVNALGQEMVRKEIPALSITRVDVQFQPVGIYFLMFRENSGRKSSRSIMIIK